MVLQQIRIGDAIDVYQYDDVTVPHTSGIACTAPISAAAPTAADHVLLLGSMPTIAHLLTAPAVIADHAIVRGDGGARIVQDSLATISDTGLVTVPDVIRGATSLWWDAKSSAASSASPGASGATHVPSDANTLGGYQLNAASEKLYFNESITSVWDGASDLQFRVTWEINEVAAADGDVDLQLICYYKGDHEIVNKTQTLNVAHTVTGDKARYTRHATIFTINWDEVGNIVEVGDKMSFILNCEATGDVTDVIINTIMFRYKTNQIQVEV